MDFFDKIINTFQTGHKNISIRIAGTNAIEPDRRRSNASGAGGSDVSTERRSDATATGQKPFTAVKRNQPTNKHTPEPFFFFLFSFLVVGGMSTDCGLKIESTPPLKCWNQTLPSFLLVSILILSLLFFFFFFLVSLLCSWCCSLLLFNCQQLWLMIIFIISTLNISTLIVHTLVVAVVVVIWKVHNRIAEGITEVAVAEECARYY